MNSLRARMILGFALVAVIPLVIVTGVLATRIRDSVRRQSAERLESALGVIQTELASDSARIADKIGLLARDPELKRLVLVEAASDADLDGHLAGQRVRLDLDFLAVLDRAGGVLADAAHAPSPVRDPTRAATPIDAWPPAPSGGVSVIRPPRTEALAVDARAPIRYRDEEVGWVRGGVLLDAERLARLKQLSGIDLVLFDRDGAVIASTLREAPGAIPAIGAGVTRLDTPHDSYRVRRVALGAGPGAPASVAGLVSTTAAAATLRALALVTLVLALLGLALAIGLGGWWSLQVSRPVARLAGFSERIARGEWDQPLALESVAELRTLVVSLERMRHDLRDQRERLASGERQAAYGQMARQVAHEIKNPLTPIAIAAADLRRSYQQQRPDFPEILDQAVRTIDEEVHRLKRLLQEFSDFGRFPAPRLASCDVRGFLADLGGLFAHETAAGRLRIEPPAAAVSITADADQLRRALINLLQNGLDAAGPSGHVTLTARREHAGLALTVSDDGPGLDEEQRGRLFVPGFTTKPQGSGLGLTIVEHIVTEHGGTITVASTTGRGTTFHIRLPIGRED